MIPASRQDAGAVRACESFGVLGPWDFVGHVELPITKTDGLIARYLDRDDMVANTMNTFVSMTVHCARCHNHKFDPITQEDYYALQSVFAAVDRADRPFDVSGAVADKRRDLRKQLEQLQGDFLAVGHCHFSSDCRRSSLAVVFYPKTVPCRRGPTGRRFKRRR